MSGRRKSLVTAISRKSGIIPISVLTVSRRPLQDRQVPHRTITQVERINQGIKT
jgi:hypothetical protein